MAPRKLFPSLDSLEQQVVDRSARQPAKRSKTFDHPTAKYIFVVMLVITVIGHLAAGVWLLLNGH